MATEFPVDHYLVDALPVEANRTARSVYIVKDAQASKCRAYVVGETPDIVREIGADKTLVWSGRWAGTNNGVSLGDTFSLIPVAHATGNPGARNDEGFVTVNPDGSVTLNGDFSMVVIHMAKPFAASTWYGGVARVTEAVKGWTLVSDKNDTNGRGPTKYGMSTAMINLLVTDVAPGTNPTYRYEMRRDGNGTACRPAGGDEAYMEGHVSIKAIRA